MLTQINQFICTLVYIFNVKKYQYDSQTILLER